MNAITAKEQYEFFLDALNSCGTFLLQCPKEEIEYLLFEEFNTARISFLHENTLSALQRAGFINEEILQKSLKLAAMFAAMEDTPLWNVESVLSEKAWHEIFALADEIKELLPREVI